jgi:CDP-glucose 4,6-dehydratase
LIPDFIRAITKGEKVKIRSPYAIRPWQHVLEPLSGYLLLGEKLLSEGSKYAQAWNFGPDDADAKDVEWITKTICELWGENASFDIDNNPKPHEANYLKLDCSKAKAELGWFPKWDIKTALKSIVDWNKDYIRGKNMREVTLQQINKYFSINS